MDAVNELKGEVCNVASYRERTDKWIYIVHSVGDDYYDTLSYNDDCVWDLLCSINEFNTLVQECMTNFGRSVTYDEYREPIIALMRKSHADYVEQTGSCIADIEFRDKAADTINKESNIKPVFTQEMSDNGELPGVGMLCIVNGREATVLLPPDIDDYFVVEQYGCYRYVREIEPLPTPIKLDNGKCYRFTAPSRTVRDGYYIQEKALFITLTGNISVAACTNIIKLVPEVKV